MFYAVALMLLVVIMLLLLDCKSLYTRFFVVMFLGVTVAFFFMIQQLSIFADYGAYKHQNTLLQLDWRIFQYVTSHLAIPLVWRLRFMNLGIALYLLGTTLFNLAFTLELQPKRPKQPERQKIRYLLLCVPVIELIVQEPNVSTAMYLCYHTAPDPAAVLLAFRMAEVAYKLTILLLLARPVFILMRAIRKTNVFFLRRRLWMFSIGILLANSIFFVFFYLGTCSISVNTVIKTGFWLFQPLDGTIPYSYIIGSIIIFLVLSFCAFSLLSCQLDVLISPLTERRIQRNIAVLNEALGETLHSQKNIFFSMQILMNRIERQVDLSGVQEAARLHELIDASMGRTAEMLNAIRRVEQQSEQTDIVSIVSSAIAQLHLPDTIHLHWHPEDCAQDNTMVMVNAYSMEHVLVNVLMNAVEAIETAGNNRGRIRVETGNFLRWVVVSVIDNGCGISRKERASIFAPHYSGKKGRMNWGLGLSYAYRVVKAHMGQIHIDSQPGIYTRVVIMLPCGGQKMHKKVVTV